ncbi:MAG: hypothetical protein HC781_02260 [Leptolyngbyaceae cyanobacterium CSU_1_4]|nr:hypothetical protein [Leptolyngbyaceae cyanobacterium CSU_1_4]
MNEAQARAIACLVPVIYGNFCYSELLPAHSGLLRSPDNLVYQQTTHLSLLDWPQSFDLG